MEDGIYVQHSTYGTDILKQQQQSQQQQLADYGVAGDEAVSADVLVAGELVLVARGEVVGVAVLEPGEREAASRGSLAVSVSAFLGFLAAASLESRPPVVFAAPMLSRGAIVNRGPIIVGKNR